MTSRPETLVPEKPEPPYPLRESASVIAGFGRGSDELGIPTANIPVSPELDGLGTGVYYGWCRVLPRRDIEPKDESRVDGKSVLFTYGSNLHRPEDLKCLPMVMSIGWNPFYGNKRKAAEVHVMHAFPGTFYGAGIEISVLGYIRPELSYTSKGMISFYS